MKILMALTWHDVLGNTSRKTATGAARIWPPSLIRA
jgi:hypothetical protein